MSLLRQRLEAMIEECIELLDLLDGDCDLECGGDDEPSIAPGMACDPAGQWYWTGDDREANHAA